MSDNPYQPGSSHVRANRDDDGVTLVNIDIPFMRMVIIILKWMIASIPAMIILWIFMAIIAAIFGGMIAAVGGR